MKTYCIKYMEMQTAYFGVEANSEEEALSRFDEWKNNSEYVLDVISNSDNIDSDSSIEPDFMLDALLDDEILTDEKYKEL